MKWLTFNTSLPRERWLPKSLISTWQGHLNIMHSLVPNYEYWQSWKQSTPIQTMAAEVTAWLFTITIYLCAVTPCLAHSEQVGSKILLSCCFKRAKQRVLTQNLIKKCYTCNPFIKILFPLLLWFLLLSHVHKENFNIFSLFCKVLCVFLHWLCLFLWAVFSFFFCAHKWLLTDCTNCIESTCCFLYCNTVALMMSHPSICFTFNSVQGILGNICGGVKTGFFKRVDSWECDICVPQL